MITLDYAKKCFDYYPLTGALIWKDRPRSHFKSTGEMAVKNRANVDTSALTLNSEGYLRVIGLNKLYQGTHIIYLLMTGSLPTSKITYKDRNLKNLRWDNLKTGRQMLEKYVSVENKKSPFNGKKTTSFRVEKVVDGKRVYFGRFKSYDDAVLMAKSINDDPDYLMDENYINSRRATVFLGVHNRLFSSLRSNDPSFPKSVKEGWNCFFKISDLEHYMKSSDIYMDRISGGIAKYKTLIMPKLPSAIDLPELSRNFARGKYAPVACSA